MKHTQTDFDDGLTTRMAVEGMNRAVEHADKVCPGWSDQAHDMLITYARSHGTFLVEEARVWAYANGLPVPPNNWGWGAITARASRSGLLSRVGYRATKIPPSHTKPMPVWQYCGHQ